MHISFDNHFRSICSLQATQSMQCVDPWLSLFSGHIGYEALTGIRALMRHRCESKISALNKQNCICTEKCRIIYGIYPNALKDMLVQSLCRCIILQSLPCTVCNARTPFMIVTLKFFFQTSPQAPIIPPLARRLPLCAEPPISQ